MTVHSYNLKPKARLINIVSLELALLVRWQGNIIHIWIWWDHIQFPAIYFDDSWIELEKMDHAMPVKVSRRYVLNHGKRFISIIKQRKLVCFDKDDSSHHNI